MHMMGPKWHTWVHLDGRGPLSWMPMYSVCSLGLGRSLSGLGGAGAQHGSEEVLNILSLQLCEEISRYNIQRICTTQHILDFTLKKKKIICNVNYYI